MRKHNNDYVYTPSDLVTFVQSPFAAWMERRAVDDPEAVTPDAESGEMLSLGEQGRRHERLFLTQLSEQGRQIYEVPNTGHIEQRVQLTREAMQAGREVIFHGVLTHDRFLGEVDFLVRTEQSSDCASGLGGYRYEIWETKLAHSVRPEFLIQLCCYADMLEAGQGCRPQHLQFILGNGQQLAFRTDEYFYYYRALKQGFLAFVDQFDAATPPLPELWGSNGRWQTQAEAILEAADHLCRVATITHSQIEKLQVAGIPTLRALAETERRHIPKLDDSVFLRLREQAQLQLASVHADRPAYLVVKPTAEDPRRGLALLPPESPADVYFDVEGYPLADGGLEYLFGATHIEHGELQFTDWWAHDAAEEKQAFEAFIDWVFARWQADPGMHIYHYANYEVAAVRRLMGRYGTREAELDALLRHHVFVDLYTLVRQGLRVGEPRYSIKNLERLYRDKRDGIVSTALDSVAYYDRWLASGEAGSWQGSPLLQAIRDYNRDDCESTWQLTRWLRERQHEAGIVWLPPGAEIDRANPIELEVTPRQELARQLLAEIPAEIREPEGQRWQTQEMLAHLVEFHHREEKPLWWATFDRRAMTEHELIEDLDCLGGLRREPGKPVSLKKSLGFWYAFDPDQDTKLTEGKACFFAHALDITTDIHVLDRENGRVCLKFGPRKLKQLDGEQPPTELSLIPNEYVSAHVIAEAIEQSVRSWQQERRLSPALEDFFARRPPRLRADQEAAQTALVGADEDLQTAVVRLVSGLDHSTLCIQGPPGSGKTTIAAAAIVALVGQGKRVGITSNSHAAILNLMHKCTELQAIACLKVGGAEDASFYLRWPHAQQVKSVREALPRLAQVGLIGGTAWTFSAAEIRDTLDYLFVDEAGQVSVANLVGMAPSTKNIVLLGDQMQLAQPIQGSHPGRSGQSSLAYLLQDRATIPATLGVFLGTTWRLHPSLCRFISETMYDGRLQAAALTAHRIVRRPGRGGQRIQREAGLVFVPVEHQANSQGSDEEAKVIQAIVQELLGRELTDETGQVVGQLGFADILFVAPYNMQVRKLQAALGPQARVGSVDKFQGQEAAVVIVSMCASRGDSSPRGIEFLFNRNRLNVALSRARSLAIVVGNPALSQTRCTTIAQMALVNLFCRLVQEGSAHA